MLAPTRGACSRPAILPRDLLGFFTTLIAFGSSVRIDDLRGLSPATAARAMPDGDVVDSWLSASSEMRHLDSLRNASSWLSL